MIEILDKKKKNHPQTVIRKCTMTIDLRKVIFEDEIWLRFIWFELLNLHMCPLHTAYTAHYKLLLHLHLYLNLYTSYYTLNNEHCTPYFYTTCATFITCYCKHPKVGWGALKIHMAKWTLIYTIQHSLKPNRTG